MSFNKVSGVVVLGVLLSELVLMRDCATIRPATPKSVVK